MAQLTNIANVAGIYQTMAVTDTTQLVVELSAVSIVKRADRQVWVTGDLTYTIVVQNIDERPVDDPDDPGDPVTEVVITDTIDPTIATLVNDTLTINDIPADPDDYDFQADTGLLTVRIGTLQPGEVCVISFHVARN